MSREQINLLSAYLADLSKILMGSVVVGFFIPASAVAITIPVFLIGATVAIITLLVSILLVR